MRGVCVMQIEKDRELSERCSIIYYVGEDLEYADSLRIYIQDGIYDNGGCLNVIHGNITAKLDKVELIKKDDKYTVKAKGSLHKTLEVFKNGKH
jgi:hypothetical protein